MVSAIITTIITAVVSAVAGAAVGGVISAVKMRAKKEKAERVGIQCLLRMTLIDSHDKYTQRGYCPYHVKEAIKTEYEAYHDLGGNGFVTDFFNEIKALPDKPPAAKKENEEELNK